MRVRHSSIDSNLEYLFLLFYSLASTPLAFIFLLHSLPFAFTLITSSLNLSHHSGSYLHYFHPDSTSFTSLALETVAATLTITIVTYSVPSNCHFFHGSSVYLLQSNLNFYQLWLHFLWPVVFLLWIEKIKNVASHTRWSSVLDTLLSILIIKLSFLRVSEGIAGIFESTKTSGITSSIRVFLEGLLSVCLFDLLGGCIFGNL